VLEGHDIWILGMTVVEISKTEQPLSCGTVSDFGGVAGGQKWGLKLTMAEIRRKRKCPQVVPVISDWT